MEFVNKNYLQDYFALVEKLPTLSKVECLNIGNQKDEYRKKICEVLYSDDVAQLIAAKMLSCCIKNSHFNRWYNDGSDLEMYKAALLDVYKENVTSFRSVSKYHDLGKECKKQKIIFQISQTRNAIAQVLSNLPVCTNFWQVVLGQTKAIYETKEVSHFLSQPKDSAKMQLGFIEEQFKKYNACVNKLVEHNLYLVIPFLRHFIRSKVPVDDLIQEANIGLIEAANSYDASFKTNFTTHAVWHLLKHMRQSVRTELLVRKPIHLYEVLSKVKKIEQELWSNLCRNPTLDEIVEKTGIQSLTVLDALSLRKQDVYLRQNLDDEPDLGSIDVSSIPSKSQIDISKLNRDSAEYILSMVSVRERAILKMRIGWNREAKTLEKCSKIFKLTKERIRQIELGAIKKILAGLKSGRIDANKIYDFDGRVDGILPFSLDYFRSKTTAFQTQNRPAQNMAKIIGDFDIGKFCSEEVL